LSSPRMARSLAVLRPPPNEAVASPRMIASRLLMMLGSVAPALLEVPPEPEPDDVPDVGEVVVDDGVVVVVVVDDSVVVVVVDGVVVVVEGVVVVVVVDGVVVVGGGSVVVVLVGGKVVVVELVTCARLGLASTARCTVPVAKTRNSAPASAPCLPRPLASVRRLH
jgi:hypothetical protein